MAERTLTISSLGKTFSVTGWKIGWAIGPRGARGRRAHGQAVPDVRGRRRRSSTRARWRCALGDEVYARARDGLRAKRDRLCAGLEAAGLRAAAARRDVLRQRATCDGDGAAFCRELPERAGVVAIPTSVFYDDAEARPLARALRVLQARGGDRRGGRAACRSAVRRARALEQRGKRFPARRPRRRTIRIAMNGVTGRMGTNQHLVRSILAIREQGGIAGRRRASSCGRSRCSSAATSASSARWRRRTGSTPARPTSTRALADCDEIYFDAQVTGRREDAVRAAIAAGRHVYCEKPLTEDLDSALALARARRRGRRQARRGAGQAVPARASARSSGCSTAGARARAVGPRRVRLLGLPRSGPGAAAAVLELPRRRTAAASSPTCSPTGGTCSTSCSARCAGCSRSARPTSRPLRRARRAVRRHRRGRRLRDVRARRRRDRAAQLVLVRAGRPRRAVRAAGRRHARAPRSPACATAGCSRASRRRGRSGTPTCRPRRPPRGVDAGPGARSPTTRSRCSGSAFLRHVALDEPFPWDFRRGRARRAARPSWACSRGASGAGSRCRSCDA